MNNTEIWDKVEKTDPKYVKPITGKSYSGSSPNPHWLVRKATETFGPCGVGWGFKVLKETILTGVDGTMIHHAHIRLWYRPHGISDPEIGEVEHVGQTVFSGTRRNGNTFTDEDAPKKSITDALTKALSMLGFAGDIFLGRWDDSKYVEGLRAEAEAPPKPKPDEWVKVPAVPMTEELYQATLEEAMTYPDTHNWDECREWWKSNLGVMEMIKERDAMKYTAIYIKFTKKKPGNEVREMRGGQ